MSVLAEAHVGVYMAVDSFEHVIGVQELSGEDEGLPEILVDPDTRMVSVVNENAFSRVAIASIEDSVCLDKNKRPLKQGNSRTHTDGAQTAVTTFIVLSPPRCIVDLCFVKLKNIRKIKLDSHISDSPFTLTNMPESDVAAAIDQFPLRTSEGQPHFLCTQSAGGHFTHFQHSSTFFAVDFRCAVGTEVLAVRDGEVVQAGGSASDSSELVTSGGIHVRDLFAWNSVVLRADADGAIFEYVHVHHEGIRVQAGDKVKRGDVLCLSGSSGFCPEPHLHFEAHTQVGTEAPAIPILYRGQSFRAGIHYS